ncbi:prostaglandin F2-alpha receptor [Echeneis naucrates]|uniref:Prostaglandin F2-alpha receptor n=1 Tax=Echeneis naucrates TaxID=173247 RepID=A0A665UIJ9_ECHNA|nr:prostaglandin F2-alpha receptor [Echeneis naucrates]XP_029356823.1 prostaglandin F2-alpha receptor [Echeneis naucrates]XP_029356824.1 prostaglandin F2-alpha receptor [Echeneis naucrates]
MSTNESSVSGCRSEIRPNNSSCSQRDINQTITASIISMTVGIFSNSLALFILVKSFKHLRTKSRASFLLFASSLVVTDLLGHLINGSLVIFVYSSQKKWETFDPHHIVCCIFGVCMVFFGLSPLFLGSAMAVERCLGVTRPIFHSTVLAPHHMRKLLGLTWLLAALVAVLPVLLQKPYRVQSSRSFCFFHLEEHKDWLEVFLPLLFSVLGLMALLISIVCNTLTSFALLQARLRRKHQCRGTPYHIEMICQLLAIMLVSCICWGPLLIHITILSTRIKDEPAAPTLLLVVRMATWNQILDPWVYILLRMAVLRKLFVLLHCCWPSRFYNLQRWRFNTLGSSVETNNLGSGPSQTIKSIT